MKNDPHRNAMVFLQRELSNTLCVFFLACKRVPVFFIPGTLVGKAHQIC